MKDELITFVTAKLAKEKGFDVPAFTVYANNGTFSTDETAYNFNSRTGYSAPTQSLLQRWLREKHNIEFISMCGGGEAGIEKWYKFTIPSCYTPNKKNGASLTSTTYEQALEKGLVEALKLIR